MEKNNKKIVNGCTSFVYWVQEGVLCIVDKKWEIRREQIFIKRMRDKIASVVQNSLKDDFLVMHIRVISDLYYYIHDICDTLWMSEIYW